MKIMAILSAFVFALATGAAARPATTTATASLHVPAHTNARLLAYGADTVCKLGCWG